MRHRTGATTSSALGGFLCNGLLLLPFLSCHEVLASDPVAGEQKVSFRGATGTSDIAAVTDDPEPQIPLATITVPLHAHSGTHHAFVHIGSPQPQRQTRMFRASGVMTQFVLTTACQTDDLFFMLAIYLSNFGHWIKIHCKISMKSDSSMLWK